MALSTLIKSIRELYTVNRERKALEKREDALKEFFREQAAGKEATFEDKGRGLRVAVVFEPRTSVDLKALRLELGDKISKYETTKVIEKIIVGETKQEA